MPTQVDDLFPKIAKILVDLHAERPWLRGFIEVEALDPKVRAYSLWYEVPGEPDPKQEEIRILDFEGLWDDLDAVFGELWRRWAWSSDGAWEKVTFSLERGGKANLDVEYPEGSAGGRAGSAK